MGQGRVVAGEDLDDVGWGVPVAGGWARVVAVPVVRVLGVLVGRRVAVAFAVGVAVVVAVADERSGVVLVVFGVGRSVGLAGLLTTGVGLVGMLAAGSGRIRE